MDNQIYNIINDMSEVLNVAQMKKLQEVLIERLVTQRAKTEESDNNTFGYVLNSKKNRRMF